MNQAPLETSLGALVARYPGVRGCALVDAASGLVWHRHPDTDMHAIWEAAVDHWRLQQRLSDHFGELGRAQAIVLHHQDLKVTLLPVLRDPDVLLVSLAEHSNVDWSAWQRDTRQLAERLRAAL
jgi:hypothetical protein